MIKTIKKLLSLCLTVILIVSMCASVVAANTKESNLSDGEIGLLKLLNIITEETPELSSKVTRSELAYIVATTANSDKFPSDNEISPFYDVSTDNKYYNEICYLANQGIISGDGSGYFSPDKAATYTDACKMFSLILGYNFAEGRYTYIEMAKKAGILDGVKIDSQEFTFANALELAYNTLHCYMFEIAAFGGEVEYQVNKDCLALERFHGLLEYKGVVSGVSGTTLTEADKRIGNNELVINGKSYTYEGGQELLGLYSVYYVKKEQIDEPLNIEYIYADEDKNEILTINSDNIKDFESGEFKYYVGDDEKTIDITGRMDVIYNEVAYPDYVDADFTTIDGKISFIDNNRDRVYDVIKIESYSYAVVGGVSVDDNIIYAEYPAGRVVGDTNRDVIINYYNAGRLAYLGGIKKGDVISVKESKNTTGIKKITINKLDNVIEGKITSMEDGMISIDNKEYHMSPNIVSDETLRLGMDISAYINAGRCAVVLNNQSGTFSVGYMLALDVEGKRSERYIRIMVLDYSKQKHEFDCVENLRIDGVRYEDIDDALAHIRESASYTYQTSTSEWPDSQLIRYKVNDDGKVTHIDTLQKNYDEGEDSLELHAPDGTGANTRMYYATNRGFHYPTSEDVNTSQRFDFSIPTTTKIWFIPSNARMDESWYRVGVNFAHTGVYTVEAYNVGEYDREAEYLLVYFTPSTTVAVDSIPYIVNKISKVVHNDELCYKIVFEGQSMMTGYIQEDLLDVEISCGDVVRFTQNYKGDIVKIEKIFTPGTDVPLGNRVVSSSSTNIEMLKTARFAYGTAVAVTDNSLVQTTSISDDVGGVENYVAFNNYMLTSTTKYFVYDSAYDMVSAGSSKDIVPYSLNQSEASRVAVFTANGSVKYVYVIK